MLVSAAAGPIGTDLARWGTVVGAAIRPGAACPLLGLPASAIDQPVAVPEALCGRDGARMRER